MNRRIFAAAALGIVAAACGNGSSPTFADESGITMPAAPPMDTTGFMPHQ